MQTSPHIQHENMSRKQKSGLGAIIFGLVMLGGSILSWVLPQLLFLHEAGVGGDTSANWESMLWFCAVGIPLGIIGVLLLIIGVVVASKKSE